MRYLAAFATGLVGSLLATLLVQAMADRRFWPTIWLDLGTGLCGIGAYQLWSRYDHDCRILVAELVGSVLGTAVAMSANL